MVASDEGQTPLGETLENIEKNKDKSPLGETLAEILKKPLKK